MSLTPQLLAALEETADGDADELAYLAVTSKPEIQVRDRLAYALHKRLLGSNPPILVAREWARRGVARGRRVDLALIEGDQPRVLLEAKAMTTYNVTVAKDRKRYRETVMRDLNSTRAVAARAGASDAEVFALVLVTLIDGQIPPEHDDVIKYARRLRRTPFDSDAIDDALTSFLGEDLVPHAVTLAKGSPFGLPTALKAWLYGPYRADEPARQSRSRPRDR